MSYFDKYLDDVLYLFENCQSNVVIFEDIDRFETNLIFQKLREINTLVNNKKQNNKKLIFIYLIKDDMFISQERTKFFDFIIPIIPVITSSNAGEKFTEILESMDFKDTLDKKFLQKISIYVDDMRLVYNICNEFTFYRSTLSSSKEGNKLQLDDEKLFSMIVYKNIFPKDFSDLQTDSGFLYELMQQVNPLKHSKTERLNKEITELEDRIKGAEQEFSQNKLELHSTFLKVPQNRGEIKVDGKTERDFANRLEFIGAILEDEADIKSTLPGYGSGYDQEERIENIFLINDPEFQSRLKKLKDRENIASLNDEMESLRKERSDILSEKLAQLLERSDFERVCSQEKFSYLQHDKKLSMIMFLIKNGYIDEGYSDYITYFYPNSLRKGDKEFLIAVQGEIILPEDYSLTEVSEVYDRLEDIDFNNNSILNYDLLKYTLTEGGEQNRINAYLSEERYEFLNSFLQNETVGIDYHIVLMIELMKSKQETLRTLLLSENILTHDKVYIVILLLSGSEINKDIIDSKLRDALITFIQSEWGSIQEGFNGVKNPLMVNNENVRENLSQLDVKITTFNFSDNYKSMSQYVYTHNLYAINMENIVSLLKYLDTKITEDMIKHQPISIIKPFKELNDYIQENIETYIEQVIEFSDVSIDDELDDIYKVLNDESISEENRIAYMKLLADDTLEIEQLKTMTMVDASLEFNKAIVDTRNLMDAFYEYDDWNEILLNFVNSKNDIHFEKVIFDNYPEKQKESFFEKTILCNKLNNKLYEHILSSIKLCLSRFPEGELSEDKIDILIQTGVISSEFDVDILDSLREYYSEQVMSYILKYIDGYIHNLDTSDVYDEDEIRQLLDKNISDNNAIAVLEHFKDTISIVDKRYSPRIQAYILRNLFDDEDFEYITSNYSKFTINIQAIVFEITTTNIKRIFSEKIKLSKDLLVKILSNDNIEVQDKQLLLSRQLWDFSNDELQEEFKKLELNTYTNLLESINNHKNPKLEVNEQNEIF